MKIFISVLSVLLVSGCSYSGSIKMSTEGKNLRTIYGRGDNAKIIVERKTNIKVLKK